MYWKILVQLPSKLIRHSMLSSWQAGRSYRTDALHLSVPCLIISECEIAPTYSLGLTGIITGTHRNDRLFVRLRKKPIVLYLLSILSHHPKRMPISAAWLTVTVPWCQTVQNNLTNPPPNENTCWYIYCVSQEPSVVFWISLIDY